ncbi:MAG: hypothetical protein H6Q68_1302 [Firmicutes bacterium]|nr:hypothetical protein [Bacillota bacterium]
MSRRLLSGAVSKKCIWIPFILVVLFWGATNSRFTASNTLIIRNDREIVGGNMGVRITYGPYWFHQIAMIITATPTYAIWIEDLDGKYISTYYVTEKFYQWTRNSGDNTPERIEALPYWWHKQRGLLLNDTVTAATPKHDLTIRNTINHCPKKFVVKMEINNSFDYNEYYTKDGKNGTVGTKDGGQPALVYSAVVDVSQGSREYQMSLVGHSSPDGSDGELYSNISIVTTARQIIDKVIVKIE